MKIAGPRIWIVAALIAAAAIAVAVQWRSGGPSASPAGREAPSFTVGTLEGTPASIMSYRGHPVVLNLWASWCPPCREEMPDLQRLNAAFRARGLIVVGVDQGESRERVAAFARSLGIDYPILLDRDQRYGAAYAAQGLPTTALIDRHGVVVRIFDGPLPYSTMVESAKTLLARS